MNQFFRAAAPALLGLGLRPVSATAQTAPTPKLPVFGEVGLGYGQTLLRGDTRAQLSRALGGDFRAAGGFNLMAGFYAAPTAWRGLGVGARTKGTFGGAVASEPDQFIFNYYTVALTAKYYPGRTFNRGLYGRASYGFGQLTTKRQQEAANLYVHQYAIGSSALLGLGYTRQTKRGLGLSLEAEYDLSARTGTVDRVGPVSFGSGQVGVNFLVSF